MSTVETRMVTQDFADSFPETGEMDPRIWSRFPDDLLPRVWRHLPWWGNLKIRSMSKSSNALLSDHKFLAGCPDSDTRDTPCFMALDIVQNPEADSEFRLESAGFCLRSRNLNPENAPTRRSSVTIKTTCCITFSARASHVDSPDCFDFSILTSDKHPTGEELAPVNGIFFAGVEVSQCCRLLLVNLFNGSSREIPPIPSLQSSMCNSDSVCSRYAQLLADDENPRNVKLILPHFSYDELNVWTLIVYDLVIGSWSIVGGDLPDSLWNSNRSPTSVALLSNSIYVLVEGAWITPHLLRLMGSKLSDYPMPISMLRAAHLHVFSHRGCLMMVRGIGDPIIKQLDIWRSRPHKQPKKDTNNWEPVVVMPDNWLIQLRCESDTRNVRDYLRFSVDGDLICFRPVPEVGFGVKFVILLDLVNMRWEMIASDDGSLEGFYICPPRLEIVL